ncbi:MAG: twin-arginine translocase TatA/TatE family subunit [Bdellovibrionota bacterium]
MFNLGLPEIALVAALALLVIGPKRLPEVARTLGKTLGGLKRAFEDATGELRQEINRGTEEIRKAGEEVRNAAKAAENPAPPSGNVTADPDLAQFVGEVTGDVKGTKS